MKLTDMNQFLATQTLKNQDLIKDILLILTDVHFTDFLLFLCGQNDRKTGKRSEVGAALFIVVFMNSEKTKKG